MHNAYYSRQFNRAVKGLNPQLQTELKRLCAEIQETQL